jgi:hypothetical protein
VRVHSGVVIGAVVTGRRDAAGRLTFAFDRLWRAKAEEHLKPPEPPGEKKRKTPWLVDLDGLRLAGALFVIPGKSGGTTSVASVTVEGELFVIAPGLERFDVARASGVWLERGLPIAVHGTMIRSASLVALSGGGGRRRRVTHHPPAGHAPARRRTRGLALGHRARGRCLPVLAPPAAPRRPSRSTARSSAATAGRRSMPA